VDAVLVPDVDLRLFRSGSAISGLALLTLGLIWESR
jgi:hypothetical protein